MTAAAEKHTPGPWTIVIGDSFQFEIVPVAPTFLGVGVSDEQLNGSHHTKLAALNCVIAGFEGTRTVLNASIARAKRMRRAAIAKASSPAA